MKSPLPQFKKFSKNFSNPREAHIQYAIQCYYKNDFALAFSHYDQANKINENEGNFDAKIYLVAAKMLFYQKKYSEAAKYLEQILTTDPNNAILLRNIGGYYNFANNFQKSELFLKKSLVIDPDSYESLSGLTLLYLRSGKIDTAKEFGLLTLQKKDTHALKNYATNMAPISNDLVQPVKKFNPLTPERNIISFSLWGNQNKYAEGAIRNAMATKIIYPGWTARFYIDQSVTQETKHQLKKEGAELFQIEQENIGFSGTFWRFLVISDKNVDRFLIRDTDSIVNCQERCAVDEWIKSNKHFHLMRGSPYHTELILAGLWGGTGGIIPNIEDLIKDYSKKYPQSKNSDQTFLRLYIWPIIKNDSITHDDFYNFNRSKLFPTFGHYPEGQPKWHVGSTWFE